MKTFDKITHGYVVQKFDENGNCLYQEFCATDIVEYEGQNRETIKIDDMPLKGEEYNPFGMVQPLSLASLTYVISKNEGTNNA